MDPNEDLEALFLGISKKPEEQLSNSIPIQSINVQPPNVPEQPAQPISPLSVAKASQTCSNVAAPIDLPRFDWIQKMDSITIIFYTKSYNNPQVEIKAPNYENAITIYLFYDCQYFVNEIKFSQQIQWPCQTKINFETGKIEVIFKKTVGNIWENYGTLKQETLESKSAANQNYKYDIINKTQVNYNTCLLELQKSDRSKIITPLGKHVRVFGKIKGKYLENLIFVKYLNLTCFRRRNIKKLHGSSVQFVYKIQTSELYLR